MAFVKARDNETGTVRDVHTDWIQRWPDDYTVLDGTEPDAEPGAEETGDAPAVTITPAAVFGSTVKEKK